MSFRVIPPLEFGHLRPDRRFKFSTKTSLKIQLCLYCEIDEVCIISLSHTESIKQEKSVVKNCVNELVTTWFRGVDACCPPIKSLSEV